jgi:hypothetical protein
MADLSIVYFWTSAIPDSQKVANMINNSPYSQFISTFSVDNTAARNQMLFGKNPISQVPAFVVQQGDQYSTYSPNDVEKVLNMADRLLGEVERGSGSKCSDSTQTIDGLRIVSSRASSVSQIETDDETD